MLCFKNPKRLCKWIFWVCLILFIVGFFSRPESRKIGRFPSAIAYSSIGLIAVIIGNNERNKRELWLLSTKNKDLDFSGKKEKCDIIKKELKNIFKQNEQHRRRILEWFLEQTDFSRDVFKEYIEYLEKKCPNTLSIMRKDGLKNTDIFREANNLERLLFKTIKESSAKIWIDAVKQCPEAQEMFLV